MYSITALLCPTFLSKTSTFPKTAFLSYSSTLVPIVGVVRDIFSTYEERIGSRIAGYYDIYYFFGDDLRFKNR